MPERVCICLSVCIYVCLSLLLLLFISRLVQHGKYMDERICEWVKRWVCGLMDG
jgi:competence protein ComGC